MGDAERRDGRDNDSLQRETPPAGPDGLAPDGARRRGGPAMTQLTAIGPYQIVQLLGEGGMAQVFLAKRTREGGVELTCVVKTIRAAHAGDENFVRMFLREARILASLRHQNIVQLFDFDRVDGTLYLAMEYVEGHDLRDVLLQARASGGGLPLPAAVHIAVEALKGLDYAHRRVGPDGRPLHIVHRDLTPTNILLSREGEVKLVDFGIAKDAVSENYTIAGAIKGKLPYMAPEQLEGGVLDARADLFAMGVVLYEMATGRRPFEADTSAALIAKILRGEYEPATLAADAPAELDEVLALALATDPADRFGSAAAMLAALEKLALQLGPFPATGLRDYFRSSFELSAVGPEADESARLDDTVPLTEFLHALDKPAAGAAEPAAKIRTTAVSKTNKRRRTAPRRRRLVAVAAAAVAVAIAMSALVYFGRSSATAPQIASSPARPAPESPALAAAPTPANAPPAALVVHAVPWANVYLDTAEIGRTPLGPTPVKPGSHQILLTNADLGKNRSIQRTFEAGATVVIDEDLTMVESPAAGCRFVAIPAGRFQMGSPGGEPGRKPNETRHWVTIGAGFLLGATAVTQGQWQKVMGVNPSFFKNCGVDCPVESVSWFEAVDFCNRLSDLEGLSRCYSGAGDAVQWDRTCQGYRLPTEAEWEYAARAGSATPLYSGPLTIRADNDGPELDPISWYGGNSAVRYAGGVDCSGWKGKQYPSSTCGTHPVAGKRKNGWGLYDMQGNVWQWVWDWEGEYPADPVLDPAGPDRPNHGARRADRGGSWDCYARFCRSANRDFTVPGLNHYSLGFRLARSLPK